MEGDKLVIELEGARLAIDTSLVAGIVEVERLSALPGQSGFVNGIISLRGEPVTVVDIGRIFASEAGAKDGKGPHKVVVVKEKNRLLGLDIRGALCSFLWSEELKGKVTAGGAEGFSAGSIRLGEETVKIINLAKLFDEAARILSTERQGA